jgi:hypothetical protein
MKESFDERLSVTREIKVINTKINAMIVFAIGFINHLPLLLRENPPTL